VELTDTSLLLVLGAAALAVFVLVVADRPRWGGPVARRVVRTVEVLGLNVLVVALAGAALNDQYVFYSSWSDLLGARSSQVELHHGGDARGVASATVVGPGVAHDRGPHDYALPQPGRRLQSYTVTDRRTGSSGQVLVYLPPGYDPSSSRTYPVIEGLHGFPGSPRSFARLDVLPTVDALTAAHRLAPSIVVMPLIDTPTSLDTECVNGPSGRPQTETWLSRDLPAWVVTHLHAGTARTSWAVFGYSYGAWCAASLSMRHPDVFGAAIVMQGYFRPDFGAAYDPLTARATAAYDLVRLARTSPPPVAMWILTTRQDTLSYPSTSAFLSVARRPLDVSATVLATGGHRDSVWEPHVPAALTWLGRTLPGFRG
jgi:S-formylglutathione hydrolase FrmB